MWLLRNDEKGLLYRVVPGKQHIVSRKDGDLLLLGDQSISRKHAQLYVQNDKTSDGIVLKDLQSKYGTFTTIGEGELTQLPPNEEITLKSDDSVRFGIQWNCWRVEFVPLLVAMSTLSLSEKAEVRQLVSSLGGEVVADWQDKCTHLTMNKLTVTIKVVCALAAGQPIVTPAYWAAFSEALSTLQSTLPNCKDYQPPLAEAVLNPAEVSFDPNPARAKLFSGYTFVASTAKQLSRIKPMVNAAGGQAVAFSSSSWSETKLMEEKTILMQHSANERQGSQQSQIPDGYLIFARKLNASGVRCIPESEIGLCVLYCSMSRYCNPRFCVQSLLGSSSSSLEATQQIKVVCQNSEETSSSGSSNSATVGSSHNFVSKKRPLEDKEEGEDKKKKCVKKPKARQNSDDIFNFQDLCNEETQQNPNLVESKHTHSGQRNVDRSPISDEIKDTKASLPGIVNPSLDMFAPSGSIKLTKPVIMAPSLDMFAPSGSTSKSGSTSHNHTDVKSSCEDMFNSKNSNKSDSKTNNGGMDIASSSNLQTKTPFAIFDDKKGGELTFPKRKFSKLQMEMEDDVDDEFSFASSKNSKVSKVEHLNDEFSFSSSKRPTKRTRQSDPDMFGQSSGSSASHSVAGPSNARKIQENDEFSFKESTSNCAEKDEQLFNFPSSKTLKKPQNSHSLFDEEENDSKFKIALLTRKSEPELMSQKKENESVNVENKRNEKKNLTIYCKATDASVKLENVHEEEMDELACELQNATIVVVKSLLVSRSKPAETTAGYTGKNFKKFRKVMGLNKRVVPHIIGGSDLIPHQKECDLPDDLRLPPAAQQTPDDDWTFLGDKKKGRGR